MYKKINPSDIAFFQSFLDTYQVIIDKEDKAIFGKDETEDLFYEPDVVLLPKSTEEVSKILAYCNTQRIAVTARGAGTGLSGGALPICGGVSLSTKKMDQIIALDEKNLQVVTQPGVITQDLQEAVEEKGLYYPPDPASRGSCFIGGNVAENSGGPRAVKYGVVKDYVLNLEVVLADGTVMWTGASVLKNATGYNLTQLMVGSEGTLGIITSIVLRLIPKPTESILMLAAFDSVETAVGVVANIFQLGITPSALEFMERDALELALEYVADGSQLPLGEHIEAHLIIELDGNYKETLLKESERIYTLLTDNGVSDILFADTEAQKSSIWRLRRSIGEAVKRTSIYKEEDTVVPRFKLPELLQSVKSIGRKYGFRSVCYGHAGDGNLHINILKDEMTDEEWYEVLPLAITKLFTIVHSLGGTLSGEHGIGLVQKNYLPIVLDKISLQLMKQIKSLFDPNEILNPGKIFPKDEGLC